MDGESGECILTDIDSGNWWDDIVNTVLAPFKALFDFLSQFWDALSEFIEGLFVPSDSFWDDNMTNLSSTLSSKFGLDGMENIFGSLQNSESSNIPNFNMTLFGSTITIFDMSFILDNIGIIHSVVYFVFGFLLIKYNMNNVYKMVRGGSLYDN